MFGLLLRKIRLSVRPSVTFASPEKMAIATDVIERSFESLFHLVLGKLKLVTEGHP